jgi:hypothetical protein
MNPERECWVREVDARKDIKESTAKPGIRSEREARTVPMDKCGMSSLESADSGESCGKVR